MPNRRKHPGITCLLIMAGCLISSGCAHTKVIKKFYEPGKSGLIQPNHKSIKVHMKDGCLYLLDSLITQENTEIVIGNGFYFDQFRVMVKSNKTKTGSLISTPFVINLSDVALFETNETTGLKGKVLAMTLVAVPTALVTIYCLINPKACFGSCPTFYASTGKDTVLMAEGFSSSILRSFEKRDIDMLYGAKANGNEFNLRLTNEALETHVIRYADLLVFPRAECEKIFSTTDGSFYKVTDIRPPTVCSATEGDILEKIEKPDNIERYSVADSSNLLEKEFVEMEFDSPSGRESGLVISCRQTFMTTYLFYQSLAYLGTTAGKFAAKIEAGDSSLQRKVDRVWNLLGGIEVSVLNEEGNWIPAGEINEMGPIASDFHLIRLPVSSSGKIRIRMEQTKGLWRIDYLALAGLDQPVEPLRIKPSEVISETTVTSETVKPFLSDNSEPLITIPGDSYKIVYKLPPSDQEYEFFLDSKGYYIEWMRESWIAEEDRSKAALLFGFPRLYMKMAASEFKKIEPEMEANFWKSRYVRKEQ